MIGAPLKRFEDPRLLTGKGAFTDDVNVAGAAVAAFLRSPHAHADIRSIDTAPARAVPGVIAVFTARELMAGGAGRIPSGLGARARLYPNRDGGAMADPPYHTLAAGRVRFVGDPVALVVAEDSDSARRGCDALVVNYEPLAAVTDARAALAPEAPPLWDAAPGNLAYDWAEGDAAAVDRALARAAHVVGLDVMVPRVAPSFLEPRAALARFDRATRRFELRLGCQGVHTLARRLAQALGVGADRVRVVSRDVGGAFGARSVIYPEYVALAFAARAVGRPIKWAGSRSEEFLSTTQGRDNWLRGTLGLDAEGDFLALRVEAVSNMGARHTGNGPFSVMRNLARMLPGVYKTPAVSINIKGAFTNTVPMSSYRGVGRMEANYLLERLIERAARETGRDRVVLRRQNLIAAASLPARTPMGALYDSGDYGANMERALAAADWDGFAARREVSARAGRLRGIALGNWIEGAGGSPGEYAALAITGDGAARLAVGAVAQGQGHETTLRQIAAEALGIAVERLDTTPSDTALIKDGYGTNASRSMVRAGPALLEAARAVIDQARGAAARLLQCDAAELDYAEGRFRSMPSGRVLELFEIARLLAEERGEADGESLFGECHHDGEAVTYPSGSHVCEVEIDPETGAVTIVRFTAVDDVGRAVNPLIVRGQSQGAIAQGIGEALFERVAFDLETGQPLSGSFLDYALPRARDLPTLNPIANDTPSPANALGVKGAGEGGTTGAPAAVINAVLDALAPLGVHDIEMPASAARVFAAMRNARQSPR